jgi:hypothetical protein
MNFVVSGRLPDGYRDKLLAALPYYSSLRQTRTADLYIISVAL